MVATILKDGYFTYFSTLSFTAVFASSCSGFWASVLTNAGDRVTYPVLGESGVRDFYQTAYRECAIINSRTFPSARSMQELVTAWKLLRKWRR
jgi:hypothetical protein